MIYPFIKTVDPSLLAFAAFALLQIAPSEIVAATMRRRLSKVRHNICHFYSSK